MTQITRPGGTDYEQGAEQRPHGSARWVLGAIALLLIAGLVWWSRRKTPEGAAANPAAPAADRPVSVTTAPVETKDVPVYLEGLGSAAPLRTVAVKSQVDGRLDKVLFKEGDSVKAGQVIAQVDPRPFLIQLHQAQAALLRDEAQLRNANLNLGRYKSLRSQNLIPQQQVDDQQTSADQLAATVKNDDAQIENAKLLLDYASIKAPVDGVTGIRQVDPGNLVHASDATGIVIITQLDPMAVLFTLPQDDLSRVSDALAAGKPVVEAYSRDGSRKLAAGQLELIDNQVNATTATIRLKAVLPNPNRALWPNQFINARLLLETRKGALTLPAAAVQHGPQGTFVYVVGGDDKVSAHPVDVDSVVGTTAILKKGVSPGDQVVVEGTNQLRPGSKVSVHPASGGAPAGSAAPAGGAGPRGNGPPRGSGSPASSGPPRQP